MLNNVLTAAVAVTSFVWFHLTCCRFLDEADALLMVVVLLITFVASVMEIIPRNLPADFFRRCPFGSRPTAWDVVLAATDGSDAWWKNLD